MTGDEYYQEILETIDEQEVDQMIKQCTSIAVSHNCSPYQVMIDLLHFKWNEANQEYWENKNTLT